MKRNRLNKFISKIVLVLILVLSLTLMACNESSEPKEVTFRVNEGYIEWQYIGDESWTKLYNLSLLKGEDGLDGENGKDGVDGQDGEPGKDGQDGENGKDGQDGESGKDGVDGINGKEVEFRVNENYLEWKYTTDLSWTKLLDVSTLVKDNNEISDIESVNKIENAINNVVEKTKTSIFGVANYKLNSSNKLVKDSLGSGFIYKVEYLDNSGNVITEKDKASSYLYYGVTNKHVVIGADSIKVYLASIDEEIPAEVIMYDTKIDVSVIKFVYSEYLEPLPFGNSNDMKTGDFIIAVGNPQGFEYSSSATLGIVSYPLRYMNIDTDDDDINDWEEGCIQHDASINPGNSGGPLINIYGEVVGINTLKIATTDVEGMGFSITSNIITSLIPLLEKGIAPERVRLGIRCIAVRDILASDETKWEYSYVVPENVTNGIYVTDVDPGSICEGILQKDDILIEFDGVILKQNLDLSLRLHSYLKGVGTQIKIKLIRNGVEMEATLSF